MIDSRTEFCTYVKNRIITKLTEAEEYELLCYALFGMGLLLRQSDILKLEWEQIDFSSGEVGDVYLTKLSNQKGIDMHSDYILSEELINALEKWYGKTPNKELIFPNLKKYSSAKRIGEIIGDICLSANELRSIGIVLKSV